MRTRPFCLTALLSAVLVLLTAPVAFGHIKIYPTESTLGAREKYTMRVPNEKKSPTIRVEGEFPPGLDVYDFEFKPGWKIDFKKDDKGKIVGAVWTGRIEPYEFVEFGMLAINPKEGPKEAPKGTADGSSDASQPAVNSGQVSMLWKFHQYYEDGTKEEFTAPPDAKMPLLPMPLVILKPATKSSAAAADPAKPSAANAAANAAANTATANTSHNASPGIASADLVTKGKARFAAYQCSDCHGDNGEGTVDAPALIATKLGAEQIAKFLNKPSSDARVKGMPDIPPDSADLQPLVAYILSLKK